MLCAWRLLHYINGGEELIRTKNLLSNPNMMWLETSLTVVRVEQADFISPLRFHVTPELKFD